jgi:hypothetical protein
MRPKDTPRACVLRNTSSCRLRNIGQPVKRFHDGTTPSPLGPSTRGAHGCEPFEVAHSGERPNHIPTRWKECVEGTETAISEFELSAPLPPCTWASLWMARHPETIRAQAHRSRMTDDTVCRLLGDLRRRGLPAINDATLKRIVLPMNVPPARETVEKGFAQRSTHYGRMRRMHGAVRRALALFIPLHSRLR